MTYQARQRVRRIATFGVFELHLSGEDLAAFTNNPEASLTRFLAEDGEPAPNQVVVRKRPPVSHDSGDDLIDQIVSDLKGGGGSTPDPPQALVFHQESGAAVSRYITIVLGS